MRRAESDIAAIEDELMTHASREIVWRALVNLRKRLSSEEWHPLHLAAKKEAFYSKSMTPDGILCAFHNPKYDPKLAGEKIADGFKQNAAIIKEEIQRIAQTEDSDSNPEENALDFWGEAITSRLICYSNNWGEKVYKSEIERRAREVLSSLKENSFLYVCHQIFKAKNQWELSSKKEDQKTYWDLKEQVFTTLCQHPEIMEFAHDFTGDHKQGSLSIPAQDSISDAGGDRPFSEHDK